MILLNQHLEEGKTYDSHIEMFPKLYWKNFDGKYERIRDISIEFLDGNWEVQTDSNDNEWIKTKVEEFLAKEKARNETLLIEVTEKLKAIEEVMPRK